MALSYREAAETAADPILIARTRQALVKWVMYRFGTTPTDADIRLGKAVLASPDVFAKRFAVVVAQNDFAGDDSNNDPLPDTTAGDAALSAIVEATAWPAFVREVEV